MFFSLLETFLKTNGPCKRELWRHMKKCACCWKPSWKKWSTGKKSGMTLERKNMELKNWKPAIFHPDLLLRASTTTFQLLILIVCLARPGISKLPLWFFCVCCPQGKNGFYNIKWLQIKRRPFQDMWKSHEIQMPVLLTYDHSFIYFLWLLSYNNRRGE